MPRPRKPCRSDDEPVHLPAQPLDVDAVPARAFGLSEELPPLLSPWHSHRRHQLLYAARGTLHLETATAQWLLPPQRAAWLRGGTRHRVRAGSAVSLRTVYVDDALLAELLEPHDVARLRQADSCVFAVTPLLREMILHAMRWGPSALPGRLRAERFFAVLIGLCDEGLAAGTTFRLPAARSPELGRAMRYVLRHLSRPVTLDDAAQAAGLSSRTLARRLTQEAQTSWRDFLRSARLLRAMELLGRPGAQVTQTALAVGFESLAAFSRAFEAFVGEKPKDFRRRVAAG